MKRHKVQNAQVDGKAKVYLDGFKVEGVMAYDVKNSDHIGMTELSLKIMVNNLYLGFDNCGNDLGSNLGDSAE